MSKLDKMRERSQGIVNESMGLRAEGQGIVGPAAGKGPPERLKGIKLRSDLATIPVSKLAPDPEQPREEFDEDELKGLAESLQSQGQIQPIAAWWDDASSVYRIVAGERRWRAASLANLETLNVTILPSRPDAGRLVVLQLVENLQRSDLKPMEQAKAFRKAMDANDWSISRLAKELSIAKGTISKMVSLLDLPEPIQARVEAGEMTGAAAYEVTKIADPEVQEQVAERVVKERLSRAETVEAVSKVAAEKKTKTAQPKKVAPPKPVVETISVANGQVTIELRLGLKEDALLEALEQAADKLRGHMTEAA